MNKILVSRDKIISNSSSVKIDNNIIKMINEIEYTPYKNSDGEVIEESSLYTNARFTLHMKDENTVIIDTVNIKRLQNYPKIFTSLKMDETKGILHNINLSIKPGKKLALVGPSGGGKTTICHLIPNFYRINEGEILIDGQNINEVTLDSLRKNIGIVQQDVFLFNGSIKENILYGRLDATMEEVYEAARNANIHEYIMSLPEGYDTQIGERGVKLSCGQKQRLSIARVFLKNPAILILDEATSALDNTTEILIQGALDELCKGRTTLVVAHRLSTIKTADEIIVIAGGIIKEQGTHEELIDLDGIYAKLYSLQFRDSNIQFLNQELIES